MLIDVFVSAFNSVTSTNCTEGLNTVNNVTCVIGPESNGTSSASSLESFVDEAEDVKTFLNKHQTNCGIIDLLTVYLIDL